MIKKSVLNSLKANNPLFSLILINLSVDNIKFIAHLIDEGIIDKKFLLSHLELLEDQKQYENFHKNISSLKDTYIKQIAKYDKEIFIINNDLICKRLYLMIHRYHIDLKDAYVFEFLKNDDIFDLLDNFIELGYYEQIKNNPNYLDSKNNIMIKRLLIAKLLDLDVVNDDNSFIGSIVTGINFYVADDKLNSFIENDLNDYIDCDIKQERLNVNLSDLQYVVELLKYEEDDISYHIKDFILSKNRILRNLYILNKENNLDIKNAILYKSIPRSNEEIKDICKTLGYKLNIKQKTKY